MHVPPERLGLAVEVFRVRILAEFAVLGGEDRDARADEFARNAVATLADGEEDVSASLGALLDQRVRHFGLGIHGYDKKRDGMIYRMTERWEEIFRVLAIPDAHG